MIGRREFLRAATVGFGLGSGTAFGQSRGKRKKGIAPARTVIEADQRLNRVLDPVRDAHHLPGLIGAIMAGGQVSTIGAVGIRKIGSKEPFQVTDSVHLGSNTKAMTATLIGMLVDSRKLSWQSTFRDVFPEIGPELHPQFQSATLSHLLTHRAGLPRDAEWWRLAGNTPTEQRRSVLATVLMAPPASKPGSRYVYSNVGYVLAGLIAETVADESWESLMRRRLFEPLGMNSAGFGSPAQPGPVNQPWGHRRSGEDVRPTLEDNMPVTWPGAGVHCTIPDWAKFAALHVDGARGKAKLLKPATFQALHTAPPGFDYAGGWLVAERSWAGGVALNHNGSNAAWFATIWLAPARNFAILVATNQGDQSAETACDEAVTAMLRASES
jgi:CubicO group peptidase (beta-lactamase class C family)